MRSYGVLLALLPLCVAAWPHEYMRKRFCQEATDPGLMAGRTCLVECQTNVHAEFNISTYSRPRDFPQFCEFAGKLSECFAKCPESSFSSIMNQDAETNARICTRAFDLEKFEGFLDAQKRLSNHWSWQTMASCPKPHNDGSQMFDKCSPFLNCFFGEALNAVKDGYDDLVVASVVAPLKLKYALKMECGWAKAVVDECSVLFEPFDANHTNPSSLPAPDCLRYCETTVPAKFSGMTRGNQAPAKAQYCEFTLALDDCLGKCQESPITSVIEQNANVNARTCAPDFNEDQLKVFLEDHKELIIKWTDRVESCATKGPGPEDPDMEQMFAKCSGFINCFFGEAFDAAKGDFGFDVAASASAQFKLQQAQTVGRGIWTKAVVDECSAVFKPYEAGNVPIVA